MAVVYTFRATIDLNGTNSVYKWNTIANVGDDGAHQFRVKFMEQKQIVPVDGYTVYLRCLREDGVEILSVGGVDTENNEVYATMTKEMYATEGPLQCLLQVLKNGTILTAVYVRLNIVNINGEGIIDTGVGIPTVAELLTMQQTIESLQEQVLAAHEEWDTDLAAINAARDAAETAQTAAETAETNAAQSASAAATSETNVAESARQATASATAAATSATNASQSATAASNSATAAATSETNVAESARWAAASADAAEAARDAAETAQTAAETAKDDAEEILEEVRTLEQVVEFGVAATVLSGEDYKLTFTGGEG